MCAYVCVVWVGMERWSKNNFFWRKVKSKLLIRWSCPGQCGTILQNERPPVQFPARAHAWAVDWVPVGIHMRGNPLIFLSQINVSFPFLSLSSPLLFKKRKKKSLKLIRSEFLGNKVFICLFILLKNLQ